MDGLCRVCVFADVVGKVVKNALEIRGVHLNLARDRLHRAADGIALLLQHHDALAHHLVEKRCGIEGLKLNGKLLRTEDQRVAEQLVGQCFELQRPAVGSFQIAFHLFRRAVLSAQRQIEIAQQRGQRISDVVAHGGDQALVFFQRLLLLVGLFENRLAHRLDALGQPRQLVVSACRELQLQIPVSDLLHLLGNFHNRARDAPVVDQHEDGKHDACERNCTDLHAAIELCLGKIVDHCLKHTVSEIHRVGDHIIQIVQTFRAGAFLVDAPPAGFQCQAAVFIQ